MEQIIDVEYRELDTYENKTTDELAAEANKLYAQAEAIANVSLMYIAKAGARLEIVKERLPYGTFENWCKDHLSFSKSKAEKMMKLSQKLRDKNSIFSKAETFTDIGISKVWALLSAPEEVAVQAINNPDAADMTAREFKDEIKRLKEEKEALEKEKESLISDLEAEKDLSKNLGNELSGANEKIAQLEAEPAADEEAVRINEELEAEVERLKALRDEASAERDKLTEALAKEKEKSKTLKKNMDEDIQKQVETAKAEAKEEALIEARKENAGIQEAYDESQRNIERLERQLQNNNNEILIEFKIKCKQLQIDFNSALESIDEVKKQDLEQGNKMMRALNVLLDTMKGHVKSNE